jgi:anaerobic magnesium-protoporphyrin IX monomethyl ester cyclase
MKVSLIVPMSTTKGNPYDMPFGIAYISAVLKKAGHTVTLHNLNHFTRNFQEKLIEELSIFNPEIVATGGLSFNFTQFKQILALARKTLPKSKTIIGGMVLTSQVNVVFENVGADIGVIGEAEETIVQLLETLGEDGDLADVKGIIFRDKKTGQLTTTPPRPLIMDLDTLPWPDYEGMGADEFIPLKLQGSDGGLAMSHHDNPRVMPIMTSRGCPFKCTFCCYELVESRYRMRNLDHVMGEINYLIKRFKINNLFISDDLFSPKKSRLIDFCERIKPLNLHWVCSLRSMFKFFSP